MLSLSRKKGESILIGDDIVLTVLSIRGPTVRIKIETQDGIYEETGQVNDTFMFDDCSVTITIVKKYVVRLGIEAPRQVPVLRDEVAKRIAEGEYPARVGG